MKPRLKPCLPFSGTIHWVGAGLSNGAGVRRAAERAERMVLWNRNVERAAQLAARLGLSQQVHVRPYSLAALEAALAPGDIVVSMLPATRHAELLAACIERSAHFGCSSYVSDSIAVLIPGALEKGLVVLTECGLDPGLDHLFAHHLVAHAQASVEARTPTIRFRSYCGGIPAVPNAFRYLFSWAPLGVLLALRSPARFVDNFAQCTTPEPWQETRSYPFGGETFEVYPNRDSLPFIEQYHIPEHWRVQDFVRGTLRPAGWRDAWQDVFKVVQTFDDASLAAFAEKLSAAHPMTDRDLDRIVMAVTLEVLDGDRVAWSGIASLDAVGDAEESAMARYVSLPLACGIVDVADGRLAAGLHRAAEQPDTVRRWLERLRAWGLTFAIRETTEAGSPLPTLSYSDR